MSCSDTTLGLILCVSLFCLLIGLPMLFATMAAQYDESRNIDAVAHVMTADGQWEDLPLKLNVKFYHDGRVQVMRGKPVEAIAHADEFRTAE